MRRTDFADQRRIRHGTPRRPPLDPRIVATGGDTQQPTHAGNRIVRLVIAHELKPLRGIVFVSRANQAAAFDRISRSSLSWRFSRRSRLSSSRSAVATLPSVRTHAPAPPATGRRAPAQPSGGGTQAGRLLLSCPSWTPRTQIVRCPQNRGNFTS